MGLQHKKLQIFFFVYFLQNKILFSENNYLYKYSCKNKKILQSIYIAGHKKKC